MVCWICKALRTIGYEWYGHYYLYWDCPLECFTFPL